LRFLTQIEEDPAILMAAKAGKAPQIQYLASKNNQKEVRRLSKKSSAASGLKGDFLLH